MCTIRWSAQAIDSRYELALSAHWSKGGWPKVCMANDCFSVVSTPDSANHEKLGKSVKFQYLKSGQIWEARNANALLSRWRAVAVGVFALFCAQRSHARKVGSLCLDSHYHRRKSCTIRSIQKEWSALCGSRWVFFNERLLAKIGVCTVRCLRILWRQCGNRFTVFNHDYIFSTHADRHSFSTTIFHQSRRFDRINQS